MKVLVNNAGVIHRGEIAEFSESLWDKTPALIFHESEVPMSTRIPPDSSAAHSEHERERRPDQGRPSGPTPEAIAAEGLKSSGPKDWHQLEERRRQRQRAFGPTAGVENVSTSTAVERADYKAREKARRRRQAAQVQGYQSASQGAGELSHDPWVGERKPLMTEVRVPYETAEDVGTLLTLEMPHRNLAGSFVPSEPSELPDVASAAAYAVEHPLNAVPLSRVVQPGARVVIITENQFRAAPADLILPPLLEIIRSCGGKPLIAIGNGKVPALNPKEIETKLGGAVVASGIPIVCNDVSQPANYVYMGNTTRGVPLFVLKEVAEADIRLTISTTQATLWGYGGSGMIIPAVAGDETIELNHIFSLSEDCRPGNNECHMQEDKYEAAKMVRIDMGVHVIVNNRFEVTYVGAGDYVDAHKAAIKAYDKAYRFDAAEFEGAPADIVITGSSAPTNHLFFHTGWAVVNCDPICKEGGTIIQATPCPGYGDWPGFALMDLLQEYVPPSPENKAKAMRAFYKRDKELWAGCIWWKIYEVMTRKDVVVVTNQANLEMGRSAGLNTTASLQGAFDEALRRHGPHARVAFVPYGRYTVFDSSTSAKA